MRSRHSFNNCFHVDSPCVVCLPFIQEQHNVLHDLSKPSPLTYRNLGIKSCGLIELTKFGPSHFQANFNGDSFFPCPPLCVGLFHSPFSVTIALSHRSTRMCFSPTPHFQIFCLHRSGLFTIFSFGVCSASLQVES